MKKLVQKIKQYLYKVPIIRSLIAGTKSRSALHKYWIAPDDGKNKPEDYLNPVRRSEFLVEVLNKYLQAPATVLEIGCNVGRNLHYLHQANYKVNGIEISTQAIEMMKAEYPHVAQAATIYNAPVEDVIKSFEDGQFDVVFTMAVLEHIHTDSEWIFNEMVRITKHYLITIEDEKNISERHFPRDYKRVFTALKMRQVEEQNCQGKGFNGNNFRLRVFTH